MEVTVEVFAEDYLRKLKGHQQGLRYLCDVDSMESPRSAGLILETDEQRKGHAEAEKRRTERLKRRQTEQN